MDVLYFTPDGAYRDESTGMLPTLPVPVNYPQSAAFTILTLEAPNYTPIVSIFTPQVNYTAPAVANMHMHLTSSHMSAMASCFAIVFHSQYGCAHSCGPQAMQLCPLVCKTKPLVCYATTDMCVTYEL